MNTKIFHSVNAGLYLWAEGMGLWIDGIHAGTEQGFSVMPRTLADELCGHTGFFAHTDGLLFTHLHRDHFHPEGLRAALKIPKPPLVYGPDLPENTAPVRRLSPRLESIQFADISVLVLENTHDGKIYEHDPHRSFLIRLGGDSLFIAGDAILDKEQAVLLQSASSAPVDAAFCNLYQLASPEGQAFLHQLQPSRIFLYHLPFPADDRFCNHSLARSVIRRYPASLPPLEILEHMAWLDHRPALWAMQQKGGPTT